MAKAKLRLPADPDCRPADAAVPLRADVGWGTCQGFDHVQRPAGGARLEMDTLVLMGSFALLCALGVPVAYTLGLAALIGALWADIPLEAVILKISDGTDDFALLAIP